MATGAQRPSRSARRYLQDAPDAGDRREVDRNARRPAFAHLPYRTHDVAIDYVDARTHKLVLVVAYRNSRAAARAAFGRFLARYHDNGRAYVVVLQRVRRP